MHNCEDIGIDRGLRRLHNQGVRVGEVISDGKSTFKQLFERLAKAWDHQVHWSLDIWHVIRNIAKRLQSPCATRLPSSHFFRVLQRGREPTPEGGQSVMDPTHLQVPSPAGEREPQASR